MRQQQGTLDFPARANYARNRFVVSAGNALAADWIDRWPDWGATRALIIHGEAGSGKSHLASIWAERAGAETITSLKDGIASLDSARHYVLDGVEVGADWQDETLFLTLTRFAGTEGSLLLLAREAPSAMAWGLADVASRLGAINTAAITRPDDTMLSAILRKLADDRGLVLDDAMIGYSVRCMERSYQAARELISALDNASIVEKKKPNLAMLRKLLNGGQMRLFSERSE